MCTMRIPEKSVLLALCVILAADAKQREPVSQVDAEYLSPAEPTKHAHRLKCSDLGQLEPLKGVWAKHPDHSYRGMTDMKNCPSFIADFDCSADYVDPKYHQLGLKEFRKTFEPHACELHAFNASHFAHCTEGQRIIIIGDSTMRQVFQSLACLLHEEVKDGFFVDWRDANSSQTSIPFERDYTLSDDAATTVLKQNVGMFTLRGGAEIHIQSFGIFNLSLWDDVMAQFEPLTQQDVIYVEFGAWYPRFNNWQMHKPWDRFRNDVRELLEKRLRSTKAKVLWRAYGATHFGGSTGAFTAIESVLEDLPTPEACEPAAYGEYYYDTEVMKYLLECKEECSHIHMLPVYHLSLKAHDSHHGSFGRGVDEGNIDCRHYCANVIDTWNQVLYNKLCFNTDDKG